MQLLQSLFELTLSTRTTDGASQIDHNTVAYFPYSSSFQTMSQTSFLHPFPLMFKDEGGNTNDLTSPRAWSIAQSSPFFPCILWPTYHCCQLTSASYKNIYMYMCSAYWQNVVYITVYFNPSEPLISALDRKGKVPRAELLTEITNLREEIVGKSCVFLY